MNIKQNPFSFYDFLGYLVPGAVFLYGALLVAGHLSHSETAIDFVTSQLSFDDAEVYIPFILLAYISGHFLSFISSITVERFSIWAHGYPSKYLLGIRPSSYFDKANNSKWNSRVIRFIVFAMLAPISVLDYALGAKAGMHDLYIKSLDILLINVLKERIGHLIDNHAQLHHNPAGKDTLQQDFFRYVYHYAVENAENHLPKMQNYVALYGFLRTLTFIALLLFWVLLWHAVTAKISFIAALLVAILTFLLFMGFVKFYRRFSLEALMAMAVTTPCEYNTTIQISPESGALVRES
jgi:hypothetical protein